MWELPRFLFGFCDKLSQSKRKQNICEFRFVCWINCLEVENLEN